MRKMLIVLGCLIFAIDWATKFATQEYLPLSYQHAYSYPYGGIGVFRDFVGIEFSINHAVNRGAAWGVLAEFQTYLLIVRILFVTALFVYLCFYSQAENKQIPLTLILAGALGNICDYFLYGHVIDMFHFIFWGYDYPIFNVADAAIFVGIVWLFILSFQKHPLHESH